LEIGVTDRAGRRVAFPTAPGQRLLLAGLAAGAGLPHECATGTCGSCRAKVVAGECQPLWPGAPGQKHLRGAADEILMCQSSACGPVELLLRGVLPTSYPLAPRSVQGLLREVGRPTPEIGLFRISLPEPLAYKAGQFVLVELDGIAGPRAWSMCSFRPGEPELDLLLRRAPGGACSARLFDGPCQDMPVRVFGPLGRAVFRPEEERPIVAVAGGSGIAGMLAILECAVGAGALAMHPGRLFFGLRDPHSAYALDQLSALVEAARGGLEVTLAFSETPADEAFAAAWPHLRIAAGLVHEVMQASLAAAPADPLRLHFVAGPPSMVDAAMRALILGLKVPPTEIRYDRFG
jgi:toluene monooxygenase electron transfer component